MPRKAKMLGRYKSIVELMRIQATILLAVFLISCNPGPKRLPRGDESSLVRATSTPFPTSPSPVLPTISYIPTTSPTFLPTGMLFPTPLADFADKNFRQWLSGSSDCLLPCWGGITPGKTGWTDSLYQVRSFLQLPAIPHKASCRFGECDVLYWDYHLNGKSYDGLLFGKKERLYAIQITGDYDSAISLRHIFETYGQPSQVFILAMPYDAGDPPLLYTTILYKNFQFIIKYLWWANLGTENLVACEQPAIIQLGIVAINEDQWTTTEIAANGNQDTKSGTPLLAARPISEVTNMTITDLFVQAIKNPTDICITTPLKYWH
jgi:hypothetical protein